MNYLRLRTEFEEGEPSRGPSPPKSHPPFNDTLGPLRPNALVYHPIASGEPSIVALNGAPRRTRASSIVPPGRSPHSLLLRLPPFSFESPFLTAQGRTGLPAFFRRQPALEQHRYQSRPSIRQVANLIAGLVTMQNQLAFAVDTGRETRLKTMTPIVVKPRLCPGHPTQRHFGIHLIDVLPTRPTAARCRPKKAPLPES